MTGSYTKTALALWESGGLRLSLARLPTGEFVERYKADWRTLPLLSSPAFTGWPGELTWGAARPL